MWQGVSETLFRKFVLYSECVYVVSSTCVFKCCCFDEAVNVEGKQEVYYVRIYNTVIVLAILISILFLII